MKELNKTKELKSIVWLTLGAIAYRVFLYILFSNEIVFDSDQIRMGNLAKTFATGDIQGVLHTYWAPFYPILLGTVTFFTNSVVQSAVLIAFITGSLLVPLTYFLIRQSYEHRVAVIAAIIVIFFPHLINSVFALGTENPYSLLIIGALIINWKGLKEDSARLQFLTGLLLGLAYLTRPESFGYLAFFILAIIFKNLWHKISINWNVSKQIAAFIIGFSIFATPYLFYLRYETGSWTISGKTKINTIMGDLSEKDEDPEQPLEENQTITKRTVTFLKYFFLNLIEFQKSFSFLFPALLLILIGLGLFSVAWDREKFFRESYLIIFCLLTILGYAAAVIQTRYFYVLLPIFVGWMAHGIIQLERWFQDSIQNFKSNRFFEFFNKKAFVSICVIAVFLYVLPINFYMRSKEQSWNLTHYEERDAGLWLKANGKPSAVVFSVALRPVFYSEREHFFPLKGIENVDDTLKLIKEKKIDYVIINERFANKPLIQSFNQAIENSPDFELIYEKNSYPGYKISIYKPK